VGLIALIRDYIGTLVHAKTVRNCRAHRQRNDGAADAGALRPPFMFQVLGWTARDAVGFAVGAFATVAILINVLFLQSGSHPTPIFKTAGAAIKAPVTNAVPAAATPMQRVESILVPAPPKVATWAPRTPGEVIVDIQRELSLRGFYDSALDGLYGPKTDAAIRDFEYATGLMPSTKPNEALLQAIIRSPSMRFRGQVTRLQKF
jgi:Putative peptidoglycan binding domain